MTHEDPMTAWLNKLSSELGIQEVGDAKGLLDVTREVAHNVSRPAAPLTLYLLGIAVGLGQDPASLKTKVEALVEQHQVSQ
ncbi:MAG: DUF6457 domain-containing protein [Candidatus Nanopelagicales bacterium]